MKRSEKTFKIKCSSFQAEISYNKLIQNGFKTFYGFLISFLISQPYEIKVLRLSI